MTCNGLHYRKGIRYLLFLRPGRGEELAPVGLRHGAFPVVDGHLEWYGEQTRKRVRTPWGKVEAELKRL